MTRGDKHLHEACKHEGCGRDTIARGMCYTHYRRWKRANPGVARRLNVTSLILDALPATRLGLEMETGLHEVTLLRHLPRLRRAGLVFICDHQEPGPGECRWKPVYARGNAPDHIVSPEARRAAAERRARMRAARAPKPVAFAALLAPLGV